MAFDIHQLDGADPSATRSREQLKEFEDALLQAFYDSPEGQERLKVDPDTGFWPSALIHHGFVYLGAPVPLMTVADVEEIVTELFPRKVSLSSPDEAVDAIPALVAFWDYLKREHRLPAADAILSFLREVQPRFTSMMNDPSKFGMAKSLFSMGRSAGFDMSSEREAREFFALYNAGKLAEPQRPDRALPARPHSAGSRRKQLKKIRKLSSRSPKEGRTKRK